MAINGHLLLLVVATGLFVRVWTANDRANHRNQLRSGKQVEQFVSPPNPAFKVVARTVAYRPLSTKKRSAPTLEETWTLTSCPIPLPSGIPSGLYRVVCDTGRVARLEIAPPLATADNASRPSIAPEFYAITIGSQQWYFIRLQIPNGEQSVVRTPAAPLDHSAEILTEYELRTPCLNRKFDFTGYVTNPADDVETNGFLGLDPPDVPFPL